MNVQLSPLSMPKPLDTAVVNFRDLGRYTTATGIPLRPMMVFRSATLSHLNAHDVTSLRHLGIRTIIDLRTANEQQFDGVAPESLGANRHDIPLVGSVWEPGEPEDGAGYLAERYTEMFFDNTNRIVEAIETIVREPGPVLFHCMAGKDRTGVLAASILDLLGVDDATILGDYGASEFEMPRLRALFEGRFPDRPIPAAAALFDTAPQRAMSQAIDFVRSECGSVQQLLREAGLSLGTVSALRLLLLQR
jgi:protein-tyrosine phosphatase